MSVGLNVGDSSYASNVFPSTSANPPTGSAPGIPARATNLLPSPMTLVFPTNLPTVPFNGIIKVEPRILTQVAYKLEVRKEVDVATILRDPERIKAYMEGKEIPSFDSNPSSKSLGMPVNNEEPGKVSDFLARPDGLGELLVWNYVHMHTNPASQTTANLANPSAEVNKAPRRYKRPLEKDTSSLSLLSIPEKKMVEKLLKKPFTLAPGIDPKWVSKYP